VVNVRALGAKGNGVHNDTDAFQRASRLVENAHGGTILIPPGDYLVGCQRRGLPGEPYWVGEPVIAIGGCRRPVVIRGAPGQARTRLFTAPRLRFGTFNPDTGEPEDGPPGGTAWVVSPYPAGIIDVQNNIRVMISNLELDGNLPNLEIGGVTDRMDGRQIAAHGIFASDVREVEIHDVYTHHNAADGLLAVFHGLTQQDLVTTPIVLERVRSEFNARAAFSWHGGIGLAATDCDFSHTGRGGLATPPACGLDIETTDVFPTSICRDGLFQDCRFVDNTGVGVISDGGDPRLPSVMDVQYMTFDRCQILTLTGQSAIWPKRPAFRFTNCGIHGWCTNAFSQPDPAVAAPDPRYPTTFQSCTFEDIPYNGHAPAFPGSAALIETGGLGVALDGCTITAHRLRALWANAPGMIARDSVITHAWAAAPIGAFQSLVWDMQLDMVEFREDLPAGSWYIAYGNTRTHNVRVSGPSVGWGPARLIGTIPDNLWN